MSAPRVFLAYPHYGQVSFESALAVMQGSHTVPVVLSRGQDSRLPHNFNKLWCEALNTRGSHGWTHFAMLHSDVAPEPGWLDVLLHEQQAADVQVLSAVVPLKDTRGLTSTGLWDGPGGTVRRLSMAEVFLLPQTFTAADLAKYGAGPLMVNTGCWICAFTEPWVEQVAFKFIDMIRQVGDAFEACNMPEDWDFSLQLAGLGVSVAATRAVRLVHYGEHGWGNDTVWGTELTDPGGR
jgi:hypothetical protein